MPYKTIFNHKIVPLSAAFAFSAIASLAFSATIAGATGQQSGNGAGVGSNTSGNLISSAANWWEEGKSDPVIHLIVNKELQKVAVYSNGRLISQSKVSTGKQGYETPGGIFSILSKNKVHFSNIYARAPMPFMQRLTWSGIAFHKSNSVPAYPASHGCIRLPGKFASKLFKFTDHGAQVIITRLEVEPKVFYSPDLFDFATGNALVTNSLKPGESVVSGNVKAAGGEDQKPVRVLLTRNSGREKLTEIQTILNELNYDAGEPDGWMGPQTAKAIRAFQKDYKHDVTGALNDELMGQLYRATGRGKPKNGHVYVRLNKEPLFDMAVVLADEKTPLGTHHFTAVIPKENPGNAGSNPPYWLQVSIEETGWAGRDKEDATPPSSARDALARFELPAELKARISGMMVHGSTVVISDQGISRETVAKGTDFIVLTKSGKKLAQN